MIGAEPVPVWIDLGLGIAPPQRVDVWRDQRPGPHDAHLAAQDVDELQRFRRVLTRAVQPGALEEASMRAQMLYPAHYVPAALTREAYQTRSALSRASHHHVYELSPTTRPSHLRSSSVST